MQFSVSTNLPTVTFMRQPTVHLAKAYIVQSVTIGFCRSVDMEERA